ncbi:hypothetical protein [Shewanella holmiensis]|uniref:Uncharacterized protein n=1 Tax=Shewanella holmiensis TaxID=2952222 RepID=A0A9X2WPG4_9GAMM|nr:hypothetical protein [Shewanella holmiensis]MCT7943123.1 hypothetical protein [Shewanella holmiensis]
MTIDYDYDAAGNILVNAITAVNTATVVSAKVLAVMQALTPLGCLSAMAPKTSPMTITVTG